MDSRKPPSWKVGIKPEGGKPVPKGPPRLKPWEHIEGQMTIDEALELPQEEREL